MRWEIIRGGPGSGVDVTGDAVTGSFWPPCGEQTTRGKGGSREHRSEADEESRGDQRVGSGSGEKWSDSGYF